MFSSHFMFHFDMTQISDIQAGELFAYFIIKIIILFIRVSLRLESCSRKALEEQYLFRGSYKLSFFFF